MEVVVNSKSKEGNRGVYRITYINGYVYCGSFVNRKRFRIAETYFGSSSVAMFYNWRKSNCVENSEYNKSKISKFEIWYLSDGCKEFQIRIEQRLIRYMCRYLGIADCALVVDRGKNKGFTSQYRNGGCVINLQAQDCKSAYVVAHAMLKAGIISDKQRGHYVQMPSLGTAARTEETFKKMSRTKRANGRKCKVIDLTGAIFVGTAEELSDKLGIRCCGTFHDAFKSGRKEYQTNRGKLKGYKFIPL